MKQDSLPTPIHPTGELSNNNLNTNSSENQPIMCDTYAGLVHVEWDPHSPFTPIGKMVFFTQFLKTCGLYGISCHLVSLSKPTQS